MLLADEWSNSAGSGESAGVMLLKFGLLAALAIVAYGLWLRVVVPWLRERAISVESRATRTPAYVVRLRNRSADLQEAFNLTIASVASDGSIRIAPRETKRWAREGLAGEISAYLGVPLALEIRDGYARFSEVRSVEIPDVVTGEMQLDSSGVLTVGTDVSTGQPAKIALANNSAVLVAGQPGSGKTVLLDGLANAFIRAGHSVRHWDGKIDGTYELDELLDQLAGVMETRLRAGTDAWRDGSKIMVLVLDEVQTALANAVTKHEKDEQAARIVALRDLVQRGRSAGVLVVLATQRPDASTIPSAIRDNAGVRICGRVTGAASVEMVMGRRPEPGEPNPAALAGAGRFVVDDSRTGWREIQAYR